MQERCEAEMARPGNEQGGRSMNRRYPDAEIRTLAASLEYQPVNDSNGEVPA
jgi:hypothetical protein